MMGFYHGGLPAQTAFHYIRIDGSLHQKVHSPYLSGLFLEYTDKLSADYLSLLLRLGHSCQPCIKTLLCIDTNEI